VKLHIPRGKDGRYREVVAAVRFPRSGLPGVFGSAITIIRDYRTRYWPELTAVLLGETWLFASTDPGSTITVSAVALMAADLARFGIEVITGDGLAALLSAF
jgi:hypothetical protein